MIKYEDFIKMLGKLDGYLEGIDEQIDLYVIGGFAMMYNAHKEGLEFKNEDHDIDTLNSITTEQLDLIRIVGQHYNINWDWINDSWLHFKGSHEELRSVSKFIADEDYEFVNINLWVADFPTLLLYKIRAIEDGLTGKNNRRLKDVVEAFMIMDHLGITKNDLENNTDILPLSSHWEKTYPSAYDFIIKNYNRIHDAVENDDLEDIELNVYSSQYSA